jgi:hypothetical protein
MSCSRRKLALDKQAVHDRHPPMSATTAGAGGSRRSTISVVRVNSRSPRPSLSRSRSLLRLGLAAMRYPVFSSIVDQRFYHLPKGRGHHQYWWDNTDGPIGFYQGAMGIKDG